MKNKRAQVKTYGRCKLYANFIMKSENMLEEWELQMFLVWMAHIMDHSYVLHDVCQIYKHSYAGELH